MKISIGNWRNLFLVIKGTYLRFPFSFISIIGVTLVSLMLAHYSEEFDKTLLIKILATLIYSSIVLTSLKLVSESSEWGFRKVFIFSLITFFLIAIYVWSYFVDTSAITNSFFFIAIILSLIFCPYIYLKSSSASVWYFNYQTGAAFFFAAIATVILGIGISVILVSTGYLFEIKISSKLYVDGWILCLGLLFPIYVLANISRDFEFEEKACTFPKGVSFIANYILVPLMVVYMTILYTYFLKIIVQWELPRGNLGWMITVFGTIGIITKLLAYPIRESGNRLLVLFDKYYFYALIVPIILLSIAIGVRIHEYGITEQRYAVLIIGLWFTTVVLISIYTKNQFHIKYIPIVLSILALTASFGPWGASSVSLHSQMARLEKLLTENNLLRDGQIIKMKNEISFKDRKSISSIVSYLSKNNYRFDKLKPLFRNLLQESDEDGVLEKKYRRARELVKLIGFDYVYKRQRDVSKNHFEYSSKYFSQYSRFIPVSGYDYVARGSFYLGRKDSKSSTFNFISDKKAIVVKANKDASFKIIVDKNNIIDFSLSEVIYNLQREKIKAIARSDLDRLTLNQMTKNGKVKARLYLNYIKGDIQASDKIIIKKIRYVLLLKFE